MVEFQCILPNRTSKIDQTVHSVSNQANCQFVYIQGTIRTKPYTESKRWSESYQYSTKWNGSHCALLTNKCNCNYRSWNSYNYFSSSYMWWIRRYDFKMQSDSRGGGRDNFLYVGIWGCAKNMGCFFFFFLFFFVFCYSNFKYGEVVWYFSKKYKYAS